jgi:hypothetical protein
LIYLGQVVLKTARVVAPFIEFLLLFSFLAISTFFDWRYLLGFLVAHFVLLRSVPKLTPALDWFLVIFLTMCEGWNSFLAALILAFAGGGVRYLISLSIFHTTKLLRKK